ncbi:hypothetical protein KUV50_01510 [Membranicola marinus]|uniref:Uncharacterized protein n=1 Tax=Membranihabitans marinus TaxID=1227546 RepID=A0A953HKM3_9BACT|nr:hypothetical protein [Membranihabitans marinus]MBY5956794.1 hypothetical protein [Membranihabitans marinus]
MRRIAIFIVLLLAGCSLQGQITLPVGSHPPALDVPYFPNKAYAVVWRNWNLVPLERIAEALQCTVTEVEELGESMGLPPSIKVPNTYDEQMYITVVRRNWHLLPYDQLLTVLDKTADELSVALKEDDFLYIKLGSLKPDCAPVYYTQPTSEEKARADHIRRLVKKYFPDVDTPGVPRFDFIDHLKNTKGVPTVRGKKDEGLRFIYSYFGVFGDPLTNPELDPYPDGLLARLASHGVNGVWLHVVLNQLVEVGGVYPELGAGSNVRLRNLKNLVDRAARYGISVYLYMNEPRAMPVSFFDDRKSIQGVRKGDFMTMCTSTKEVLDWLSHSLSHVFQKVPGLGGVFTITASENLTSCASHNLQENCPRCSKREYADLIADVNKAIEKGVHQSAPDAKVIAWDWGWYSHGDGSEIIRRLPKDIWVMSASEWKTPFQRGGVEAKVGEYSISVVGPGPRAQNHWKVAQERGLKTVAKMQLNNTWELSAVPWLPVLDLNAEHLSRLAGAGLNGYMLSWSLGGYPSPNLELAQMFNLNPGLTKNAALDQLAEQRYGPEGMRWARQAWAAFSAAFQEFPYDINTVYNAPQQYGASNLLYLTPTGYKATMVGLPYDDLDGWRGPYSRTAFADQFQKLADGWEKGLRDMESLMDRTSPDKRGVAVADFAIAKAAGLHFRSVANQCRFIIARDNHLNGGGMEELRRMENALQAEIQTAVEMVALVKLDARIGFEASNQYYYVVQDLMEKVLNGTYLLDQLLTNELNQR